MAIEVSNLSVHMVEDDAELYRIWPSIRDGINAIEKRCKGVFYRPEDVYHELKSKQAQLLVGSIDGEYQGFAIIHETTYPDGKGMHIWTMHNAGKDRDFVDNLFAAIAIIAELCKVVRVSYSSSRKGWEKRTESHGYKRAASVHYYEKTAP
jgi:hypothetical protein